jgi:hypothetical protein
VFALLALQVEIDVVPPALTRRPFADARCPIPDMRRTGHTQVPDASIFARMAR